MYCPACTWAVEWALRQLGGVQKATVSWERGEAVVEFRESAVTVLRLIEAVEKMGFEASLREVLR
jgi:copper chaperone CopZ